MAVHPLDRLIGAALFRPSAYRHLAGDDTATLGAGLIVGVVALVSSLASSVIQASDLATALLLATTTVAVELAGWLLSAWLMAAVCRRWLHGHATTAELLRIMGYASLFKLLAAVPVLGLAGAVLALIATMVGLRAATGLTRVRVIGLVLVTGLIQLACSAVAGRLLYAALASAWTWLGSISWDAVVNPPQK